MAKYRKKPVVIDAVQWTGDNKAEVYDFVGNKELIHETDLDAFVVLTLRGYCRVAKGDWVVRGVKGEFYPCRSDIFRETYEPVGG